MKPVLSKRASAPLRFWKRVDKSGGPDACWLWTGARHYRGYGRFGQRGHGHEVYTHRFAYADANGPIPEGLHVLHACDNPPCCNPAHLSLGTHRANMADMARKKRCPPRHGEHSPTCKLTEEKVRAIRERAASGERRADLAAEFGVAKVTVEFICQRRLWKHVA